MLIWIITAILTLIYLLNIGAQLVKASQANTAREASVAWIYVITNGLLLVGILYLAHAAVTGVG